jgi:hypothetical protein
VSTVTGAIATVHRYTLPLSRDEVWSRISEVSSYRGWWPWLRAFDAAALAEGDVWRCQVQPPVPYPVRFTVTLEQIEPPALVRASVHGDVVGDALLTLEESGPVVDGAGSGGGSREAGAGDGWPGGGWAGDGWPGDGTGGNGTGGNGTGGNGTGGNGTGGNLTGGNGAGGAGPTGEGQPGNRSSLDGRPGADGACAGCVATLHSSLAPGNTALQLVSRFAAPVARFGHDWVLDSGARQFIARAVVPMVGD